MEIDQTDRINDRPTVRHNIYKQIKERQLYRQMDRRADRLIVRHSDGQTGGWTDKHNIQSNN